ncbi:restriction endonuclease subunit S [Vibrio parahaemolyticus]|uniref:restriction endonuclease subunit S n=1 Tax=Vibrio parahaemolyticus TaxID=670 RepID=UPI0005B6C304|nr:restriction endonuclease subunit S [Vibrio parahaemolyticus]KIT55297.1 hypothetical protein H334_03120 [Vibrio parahaemolyticus 901128]EGR3176995.1 restriction endonuclease subunit S [Vibrio parahaemolyticus]EIE1222421.1 restriction endonuclease subunit S [Vibrio parahaemolyticus]EIE1260874.1 restriction endonuclease subunit S [Vibrio parahaemolyticus]EIE1338630.1 restriction endonuclease subunit S [Vibrio parahaemolyticus]
MSFELPFKLPTGWQVATVDELVKQKIIAKPLDGNHGGIHPKASDYIESGVPFVMASDLAGGRVDLIDCKFISEEQASGLRKGIAKAGDVLLSHKATIGRTAIVQDSKHDFIMLTPQVTYYRVINSSALSNIYLKAYFDSRFFQSILGLWAGAGSTRAYLGITGQLKLPIILPPIEIQNEISGQVHALNKKVNLNNEINQTLEEMAQAIFKSWFVDFDPVKAKMNGKQPEGMDAATASLFPEKLVESELGLIPDGWEVTKLSKVIDLLNGFAFKSSDYVKEGTFVLRTKNFDSSNSVERLGDDVYLPDEFLESHKKYLCEAYDYHVVMVAASIGKTAMIYPHQLPALRNQNMWCFRPKDESLRFYTKYMVDGLVKLNMGLASGSARAFFKKGDFNSYEFALPSSELLTKFNDVVGNLVRQKGSLLNQNVQLAAMRDTLLPKLLSGEIELGATEALELEA